MKEEKHRTDTDILLDLLVEIENLDTHSHPKAIIYFEKKIHEAIKEVGEDRLNNHLIKKLKDTGEYEKARELAEQQGMDKE